jgi:hypothetical protein
MFKGFKEAQLAISIFGLVINAILGSWAMIKA